MEKGTVRRINSIDVYQKNNIIQIIIRGNAFLHNMIRIIMGTTLELARNNDKPAEMKKILSKVLLGFLRNQFS